MSISAEEISTVLCAKKIDQLYHANTVLTTLSFLRTGGILSRGAIEQRKLPQTPQTTDRLDKQLGIWNDVFFDSADIHQRASELNKYGPITLVFDKNLVLLNGLDIKITKDNPIRWIAGMSDAEKYFCSTEELAADYSKGAFHQHLTLHNMLEPVPFVPYLRQIIIDNPRLTPNSRFDAAFTAIQEVLSQRYPGMQLQTRECPSACQCTTQYNKYRKGAIWYKYRIK